MSTQKNPFEALSDLPLPDEVRAYAEEVITKLPEEKKAEVVGQLMNRIFVEYDKGDEAVTELEKVLHDSEKDERVFVEKKEQSAEFKASEDNLQQSL